MYCFMVFDLISRYIFSNLITADVEEDGSENEDVPEEEAYFHNLVSVN